VWSRCFEKQPIGSLLFVPSTWASLPTAGKKTCDLATDVNNFQAKLQQHAHSLQTQQVSATTSLKPCVKPGMSTFSTHIGTAVTLWLFAKLRRARTLNSPKANSTDHGQWWKHLFAQTLFNGRGSTALQAWVCKFRSWIIVSKMF
jgi:hypothetical protein